MNRLTMWILVGLCSFTWAADNEHNVILKFDRDIDFEEVFSDFDYVEYKKLNGHNVYKAKIRSDLSPQELAQQLDALPHMAICEKNQKGYVFEPEDAADLEQRAILILDQRAILILDESSPDNHSGNGYNLYTQDFLYQIYAPWAWWWSRGWGVKIAVLDTGVDMDHPFLVNNLTTDGYDFVDRDNDPDDIRTDSDANDNGLVDEGWGHGTHVAGIIKMVAPEADIMPIRVIGSDGEADLFDLIEGFEYALDQGADIINLSMSIDMPSLLLDEWMQKAKAHDVLVVTSSGNDNDNRLSFPANEESVVTVSSVDPMNYKSDFSNYSGGVDVSAPGEDIWSCLPGGGYVKRSGTSMASPIVAAQAAILMEYLPGFVSGFYSDLIKVSSHCLDARNQEYAGQLGWGVVDVGYFFYP